ncbi:MAG: hypothetical protein REI96_03565 [Flavobacterium nitrogenifigens]|uniref:hypothetical protein n=1 Tax=Flavobacterium nitrogenifigens TaxID=1617283 RepID=UPI00280792E1|nr:hypothetical protein [Flavobacterium nitrogenifigens]MDQ8011504.1 hypothetical protein [Flavobacterium nitrogenifigens]
MRVKLLTTISIFTYQLSVSQNEKVLNGKVFSQNIPLNKVEVINKTAKTSTRTNELGEFSILVRPQDSVLFFSKDYFFKRLKISQENIDQNNIIVNMILKPEELDEVLITTIKFPHVSMTQEVSDSIALIKASRNLQKYTGVYDGTISNGMNFGAMGAGLFGLFKKEENSNKKPKKKTSELDFKTFVEATCPLDFFTKDLKLNPDEKALFLEFCTADPQSEVILKQKNLLYTMDFLYAKNQEFKKLKTEIKN